MRQPTSPVSSALQTTCRELQSLIANTHRCFHPSTITTNASSAPPRDSTSLQSPIELTRDPLRSWRAPQGNKIRKPPRKALRNTQRANKPLHISIPRSASADSKVATTEAGKENQAPMTPVRGSCAPPVLPLGLEKRDFEALAEEGWPAQGTPRPSANEGGLDAAGSRRTKLDRCDEVVVGALLRRMRLQRWEGRSEGRRVRK
ncbi:MAG: hypothetical protein LQ346_004491 [Caloplaca aetnensis]|nr:MAG: hypothetical protein LQ346_004491 [Caloplaca aetnensis]